MYKMYVYDLYLQLNINISYFYLTVFNKDELDIF